MIDGETIALYNKNSIDFVARDIVILDKLVKDLQKEISKSFKFSQELRFVIKQCIEKIDIHNYVELRNLIEKHEGIIVDNTLLINTAENLIKDIKEYLKGRLTK